MKTPIKNLLTVGLLGAWMLGMATWSACKPADEISESERRQLAQFPTLSADSVFSQTGDDRFMNQFAQYTVDQFPMRDTFRRTQALFSRYVFGQTVQNDIYAVGDHLAKLDYPLRDTSLSWALSRFREINDTYLANAHPYVAVIPDKNAFLAAENGYPALDYEALYTAVRRETADYAQVIDIDDLLTVDNYYRTDAHWRQETLLPIAQRLLDGLGTACGEQHYTTVCATDAFYGVYYGQSALPAAPEELLYLTNDTLQACRVTCYDDGTAQPLPLYDLERADGRDGYELFLSGSRALITIDNPTPKTDKTLVLFRDSFGSSLAPLLAEGYARITVVDIRYLSPSVLGRFVDFENADVLFLYSTSVLNNSEGQLLK